MSNSATPATGTEALSLSDAAAAFEGLLPDEGEQVELDAESSEEQSEEVEPTEVDETEEGLESEVEEEEAENQVPATVEIDGEQVPLDDLKASYFRTKDYTRKTQELSEQRKAFEQEYQQVSAERQQYQQLLGALAQQIQQSGEREPDWDSLRATDPIEFTLQWTEWQRKQQKMQVIQQEQARLSQMQELEQRKNMEQMLVRERQALEAVLPDYKDPEKGKAIKQLVIEQGKKLGFSEQELGAAVDHRAIVALHKAALYDQMMSKKTAATPTPQKVVKPGTTQVRDTSVRQKAFAKAQQSGKLMDAARAVEFLLK